MPTRAAAAGIPLMFLYEMQQRLQGGIAKHWALQLKECERGSLSEQRESCKGARSSRQRPWSWDAAVAGLGEGVGLGCRPREYCLAQAVLVVSSSSSHAVLASLCPPALPCSALMPSQPWDLGSWHQSRHHPTLPKLQLCGCCPMCAQHKPNLCPGASVPGNGTWVPSCHPTWSCCRGEFMPHLAITNGSGCHRSASPPQLYKVARWNIDGFGPQSD